MLEKPALLHRTEHTAAELPEALPFLGIHTVTKITREIKTILSKTKIKPQTQTEKAVKLKDVLISKAKDVTSKAKKAIAEAKAQAKLHREIKPAIKKLKNQMKTREVMLETFNSADNDTSPTDTAVNNTVITSHTVSDFSPVISDGNTSVHNDPDYFTDAKGFVIVFKADLQPINHTNPQDYNTSIVLASTNNETPINKVVIVLSVGAVLFWIWGITYMAVQFKLCKGFSNGV